MLGSSGGRSDSSGYDDYGDDEEYEAPPLRSRAAGGGDAPSGGGRNQPRPVNDNMNEDDIPF
jgi:hypothetical protein